MISPRHRALRFVLLVGAMSFFADFAYEGARGIAGPYLALLGASGAIVGAVSGLGELLGYGLRLVSGRLAEKTRQFWPVAIAGYVVQMAAVPALALAGSWPAAAGLLLLERIGKATRNPPRDVMLSHAGHQMGGYGWAFGLHEGLDQLGAMLGPLAMTAVLAGRHDYPRAFAALGIPALCTLLLVGAARLLYPRPAELEPAPPPVAEKRKLPRQFWIYLAGVALAGAGFADFPLLAYHFQVAGVLPAKWTPACYAAAMGAGGAGALLFGRLFDRFGTGVLIPLTLVGAAYAPLAFLGGGGAAIAGTIVWGLAMGVHESVASAAVATLVPAERRASAYGLFMAAFGVAWFAGSVVLGWLCDRSLVALVVVAVTLELAAIPFLAAVSRRR